jgi:hypothetical protein
MVMSFSFESPKIPFRPDQCPTCINYEDKECSAFAETHPLPFGTSTVTCPAVFEGESKEPCPKYSAK